MKKSQSGFTLIELVVVVVLLGILGVTALGKFQDLSNEAQTAAIEGVVSEISASSSLNYAKGLVTGAFPVGISIENVCTTGVIENLFQAGKFPTGYDVDETATKDCSTVGAAGTTVTCTIFKDNGAGDNNGNGVKDTDETISGTAALICTD